MSNLTDKYFGDTEPESELDKMKKWICLNS